MAYTKHNFQSGQVLYAQQLNEMEEQIARNEAAVPVRLSQLENDAGFVTETGSLDSVITLTPSGEGTVQNLLAVPYEQSQFTDHAIVYSNNIRQGEYDKQYCVTPAIAIRENIRYAIRTSYGASNKHPNYGAVHPVATCCICFFGADGVTGGKQGTLEWLESDPTIAVFTAPAGVSTVRFALFRGGDAQQLSDVVTVFNSYVLIANPPEQPTAQSFEGGSGAPGQYVMSGVFMGQGTVGLESMTDAAVKMLAPLYGRKILNLGDSIFGNDRVNNISQYLAEYTGAAVYNGAIGGTRMTGNSRNAGAAPAYGPFDGTAMIQALASGSWTEQDASVGSITAYGVETLALWKSLNMADIDIITLAWGTNDWTSNIPAATIAASLETIIDTIQTHWPHIRILVLTPIWRYFEADGVGAEEKQFGGVGIAEVARTIAETAAGKRVSVLNALENLPLGVNNMDRYMDSDHVHLNAEGNALYAHLVAGKLRSLY